MARSTESKFDALAKLGASVTDTETHGSTPPDCMPTVDVVGHSATRPIGFRTITCLIEPSIGSARMCSWSAAAIGLALAWTAPRAPSPA